MWFEEFEKQKNKTSILTTSMIKTTVSLKAVNRKENEFF